MALIFKNEKGVRVLSRISSGNNVVLKNQFYKDKDISSEIEINNLVDDLKLIYEDYWKQINQINTSIKFPLNIKVENKKKNKISNFEKNLSDIDLIYDFYITKFDKDHTYYQIFLMELQIFF